MKATTIAPILALFGGALAAPNTPRVGTHEKTTLSETLANVQQDRHMPSYGKSIMGGDLQKRAMTNMSVSTTDQTNAADSSSLLGSEYSALFDVGVIAELFDLLCNSDETSEEASDEVPNGAPDDKQSTTPAVNQALDFLNKVDPDGTIKEVVCHVYTLVTEPQDDGESLVDTTMNMADGATKLANKAAVVLGPAMQPAMNAFYSSGAATEMYNAMRWAVAGSPMAKFIDRYFENEN